MPSKASRCVETNLILCIWNWYENVQARAEPAILQPQGSKLEGHIMHRVKERVAGKSLVLITLKTCKILIKKL